MDVSCSTHFKMRPLSLSVHDVLTAPERREDQTRESIQGGFMTGVGDVVQPVS